MRGICGWIGTPSDKDRAHGTLDVMLGAADSRGLLDATMHLSRTSAIGARQGVVPAAVLTHGALTVAVEGRIHWIDDGIRSIAVQKGDVAALAAAYSNHGDDCLQAMHGAFAFAIIDESNARALIAVDRMGIRNLCFANPHDKLVFGTTATSVSAHPDVGGRLSEQAIFNYLYSHVVPSPGTIFQSVQKLRPGECVSFRRGDMTRRFYWRLHYHDESSASTAELQARFHRLLREATTRAVDGDVDIGAFLSGGTDSSTVTGLLTELRGRPAKTYSIGFGAEGFDEMEYARITSRHFGTDAHEYYVTAQDVADALPIVAATFDEPFGNASVVPTYLCARMARESGVKVMLAGDGGDEIFGGNARYAKQKMFESYRLVPRVLRRALIEPLAFGLPGGARIPPMRKLRSYIQQANLPMPDRLETYNFLHRSPLPVVFEPGFLAAIDTNQPLALLREIYERTDSVSMVNRMMHLDLQITLADNDLRKVSRMCEAAGVEVRYPLLDDALVEFSGSIPPSLKVKGVQLRYFFKEALRDFLPAETISKSKHGFGLPFGLWLREHRLLTDLAHDSLGAFGRRGIVRPSYIEELLRHHAESHATYFGVMIWVIMTLELWLQAHRP